MCSFFIINERDASERMAAEGGERNKRWCRDEGLTDARMSVIFCRASFKHQKTSSQISSLFHTHIHTHTHSFLFCQAALTDFVQLPLPEVQRASKTVTVTRPSRRDAEVRGL